MNAKSLKTKALHDVFLENVHARLDELGMSQRQLAELMGVTPSYVCQLLQGRMIPGLEVVERVAKALRISPVGLLQESLFKRLNQTSY